MLTLQAFRSWNWLWDWLLNPTWSLRFTGKSLSNTLDDFNRANFPKCQLTRLNCVMHSTPNSQQLQQLYSFDMRQKSQSNLQKWLLSASLLFCLLRIKCFPHSLDFACQNPVWQQSSFFRFNGDGNFPHWELLLLLLYVEVKQFMPRNFSRSEFFVFKWVRTSHPYWASISEIPNRTRRPEGNPSQGPDLL